MKISFAHLHGVANFRPQKCAYRCQSTCHYNYCICDGSYIDFSEYEEIEQARIARAAKIDETADMLIEEHLEAFLELAK